MQNAWVVLIPPLLVLTMSFFTGRIISSLLAGLVSAALILHDFSIYNASITIITRLWQITEIANIRSFEAFSKSSNLFIFLYLISLAIIIMLIKHAGGTYSYLTLINKKIKTQKAVEISSFLCSFVFFIDEYLNIMTVGSVINELTDKFKIPRVKLAFLANTTATALCILIPISSWGAFILAQFNNMGISPNELLPTTKIISTPFSLFIKAIPLNLYSFIMLPSILFIILAQVSYGRMRQHEIIANETGNLYGGKEKKIKREEYKAPHPKKPSMFDFIFPLTLLISLCIIGLFFTNFVAAPALFISGILTLLISTNFFLIRKKTKLAQIPIIIYEGLEFIIPSLTVTILAWTFGKILTDDLLLGQYLASKLAAFITLSMLPVIFFISTAITTLAICTAWGSMAIMFPIAISLASTISKINFPVQINEILIMLPTIGAIMSGAIAGINMSPISDINVIASSSTGVYHSDHIRTQQGYVIPVFISTTIAYLFLGMFGADNIYIKSIISILLGIIISISVLKTRNMLNHKKYVNFPENKI